VRPHDGEREKAPREECSANGLRGKTGEHDLIGQKKKERNSNGERDHLPEVSFRSALVEISIHHSTDQEMGRPRVVSRVLSHQIQRLLHGAKEKREAGGEVGEQRRGVARKGKLKKF